MNHTSFPGLSAALAVYASKKRSGEERDAARFQIAEKIALGNWTWTEKNALTLTRAVLQEKEMPRIGDLSLLLLGRKGTLTWMPTPLTLMVDAAKEMFWGDDDYGYYGDFVRGDAFGSPESFYKARSSLCGVIGEIVAKVPRVQLSPELGHELTVLARFAVKEKKAETDAAGLLTVFGAKAPPETVSYMLKTFISDATTEVTFSDLSNGAASGALRSAQALIKKVRPGTELVTRHHVNKLDVIVQSKYFPPSLVAEAQKTIQLIKEKRLLVTPKKTPTRKQKDRKETSYRGLIPALNVYVSKNKTPEDRAEAFAQMGAKIAAGRWKWTPATADSFTRGILREQDTPRIKDLNLLLEGPGQNLVWMPTVLSRLLDRAGYMSFGAAGYKGFNEKAYRSAEAFDVSQTTILAVSAEAMKKTPGEKLDLELVGGAVAAGTIVSNLMLLSAMAEDERAGAQVDKLLAVFGKRAPVRAVSYVVGEALFGATYLKGTSRHFRAAQVILKAASPGQGLVTPYHMSKLTAAVKNAHSSPLLVAEAQKTIQLIQEREALVVTPEKARVQWRNKTLDS